MRRWWAILALVATTGFVTFVPGLGWGWTLDDTGTTVAESQVYSETQAEAEEDAKAAVGTAWPGSPTDLTWHYVGEAGEPAFEPEWEAVPGYQMAFRLGAAGRVDVEGVIRTVVPPYNDVMWTMPDWAWPAETTR